MRNTYSVASVAEAAALAAMDDQDHIDHTLHLNADQARVLTKGLSDLGYRVVPTWANFIYCDVGENAQDLASQLQKEGVVIRPLAPWGAPHCLRVSIGTAEQNKVLLEALRRINA
jgi:histidinol-phosphate aminotransferase